MGTNRVLFENDLDFCLNKENVNNSNYYGIEKRFLEVYFKSEDLKNNILGKQLKDLDDYEEALIKEELVLKNYEFIDRVLSDNWEFLGINAIDSLEKTKNTIVVDDDNEFVICEYKEFERKYLEKGNIEKIYFENNTLEIKIGYGNSVSYFSLYTLSKKGEIMLSNCNYDNTRSPIFENYGIGWDFNILPKNEKNRKNYLRNFKESELGF